MEEMRELLSDDLGEIISTSARCLPQMEMMRKMRIPGQILLSKSNVQPTYGQVIKFRHHW